MFRRRALPAGVKQALRQRRRLHTRLDTFFGPTPESLTSFLSAQPPSPGSTSLYLLSTTLPSLPSLLPILQSLPHTIGSFQLSPPDSRPHISLATFEPEDASEEIGIWRSELSGRRPAEVGRATRVGSKTREDLKGGEEGDLRDVQGEEGWAGVWKGGKGEERVRELEGVEASSILFLSDGSPRPVLSALDSMFPRGSKLGLISAPTPFLTGRPHTLLRGKDVFDSGTVGLAFKQRLSTKVAFGLEALTDILTVASAQGNMLLSFQEGNGNPTKTLMSAIQGRKGTKHDKEEDFFLAFLGDQGVQKVVKVLSGDPGRGALSLDMEEPLISGMRVQFMYRAQASSTTQPKSGILTFGSIAKADEVYKTGTTGEPTVVGGFCGFSEDGFAHSSSAGSAVCTVPGATASWHFVP